MCNDWTIWNFFTYYFGSSSCVCECKWPFIDTFRFFCKIMRLTLWVETTGGSLPASTGHACWPCCTNRWVSLVNPSSISVCKLTACSAAKKLLLGTYAGLWHRATAWKTTTEVRVFFCYLSSNELRRFNRFCFIKPSFNFFRSWVLPAAMSIVLPECSRGGSQDLFCVSCRKKTRAIEAWNNCFHFRTSEKAYLESFVPYATLHQTLLATKSCRQLEKQFHPAPPKLAVWYFQHLPCILSVEICIHFIMSFKFRNRPIGCRHRSI